MNDDGHDGHDDDNVDDGDDADDEGGMSQDFHLLKAIVVVHCFRDDSTHGSMSRSLFMK